MKTFRKYLSLVSNHTKFNCMFVLGLAGLGSALAAKWPVMLGNICSEISNGTVSANTLMFFGSVCLSAVIINIFRRVMLDWVIASHEAEIRENSLERLLKMPESYISSCPSGEKTAQLNQGVAGLSQLIKILCGDASGVLLTALFTLWQVYSNASGFMAVIMLLYLVAAISVSYLQIKSQKGIRENILARKNSLDGKICQSINNLKLIRGLNAETFERKRLSPSVQEISAIEKKHHCYMGTFDTVKQGIAYGFLILILASYINGGLPAASAATVCFLFLQMLKPIDEIYRFMDEGSASLIKAQALLEIFDCGLDPIFKIKSLNSKISTKNIELNNVKINGLFYKNLIIPCSGKTALSGETGCGKSTVALGLIRFFKHKGNINLFGRNLDEISQSELAELVHYVPLDKRFFAGTLKENLLYGLERKVTDIEALEALDRACLLQNFDGNILDIELGEGGSGISAGQQQRLALARAFLRSPKLYIFDESTANLDAVTAENVLNNIEDHAKNIGAGIIYISHDENVMGRCDKIINLRGEVSKSF